MDILYPNKNGCLYINAELANHTRAVDEVTYLNADWSNSESLEVRLEYSQRLDYVE